MITIPDWLIRTESDKAAIADGCWYDADAADRVRRMFKRLLRHTLGQFAGQPFELAAYQFERIIAPIYGWKRPDGRRRIRQAYIELPKKAGKSTLGAGLAVHGTGIDGEQGAEVISAAKSRDQASRVFNEAKRMVKASEALMNEFSFFRSEIMHESTNSVYRAIAADADTADGVNPSLVIFDELHRQSNRELYDVLSFSQIARREPLFISITTAGDNLHSVCYDVRSYAQKVIDGTVIDQQFLPVIYSAPLDADWTDEQVWIDTHPGIGTTIALDDVRAVFKKAQETPSEQISFRRYYLNQWLQEESRWIDLEAWRNCKVDVEPEQGAPFFAGLDLSLRTDLTAFVAVWRRDDAFIIRSHFWMPRHRIDERERVDGVPYRVWANGGWLTLCDGQTVDYGQIIAYIKYLCSEYELQELAYDPWNAAGIVLELQRDGFGDKLIELRQGHMSQSGGSKAFLEAILGGRLCHDGNPVMDWNVGNAIPVYDENKNVRPSKKKSTSRIDGVMAAVNAFCRIVVHELNEPASSEPISGGLMLRL